MIAKVPALWNAVSKARCSPTRYVPVWLSLMVGIGLSAVASGIVWKWELAKTQQQFDRRADNLAFALQQNIDEYAQLAQALGAFYDAADRVNRADFAEFSQPFLPRYPGILALGWAQRVLASQREAYVESMVAQGFRQFNIWEGKATEKAIALRSRAEYLPSTYIESLEPFKQAIGFDHNSDWQRRVALEKARETGVMVSTQQVPLEHNAESGFLMYRPVYRPPYRQEREFFQGVVYIVYQIEGLIRASIGGLNVKHLDFYLFDMPVDQLESALSKESVNVDRGFLAFYDSKQRQLVEDRQTAEIAQLNAHSGRSRKSCLDSDWTVCIRTLNVADREWSLLILPTSDFAEKHWTAAATGAIGLLLTSILALYLGMSIRRARTTQQLLASLEKTHEALQRSQTELRWQKMQLEQAFHQLQQTQAQLVQTEKMSSLGQLVAGVAHEINNPVSFIYGNINFAQEYTSNLLEIVKLYGRHCQDPHPEIEELAKAIELDFLLEDFPNMLSSIKIGAERLGEIVKSLRNFSRKDEAEVKAVDIHEGIESTLMILQNRLKATPKREAIALIKEYGNLPPIECYAGQLNQVFMNILSNAIDALEEVFSGSSSSQEAIPTILIRTEVVKSDQIAIKIADNGPGMPEGVREKILDPFFTTKPVGKGTGLGLSISYQIVTEKHQGSLQCISAPGQGTEFLIQIPLSQTMPKV